MENRKIFGYTWEQIKTAQQGGTLNKPIAITDGDYGCDPMGNGKFKMIPSGDIVNIEEKERRLGGNINGKQKV